MTKAIQGTMDTIILTKAYQACWHTSPEEYYYMMSMIDPFTPTTTETGIGTGWEGVEFDVLQDMIDFCEQHEPPIGFDPEM